MAAEGEDNAALAELWGEAEPEEEDAEPVEEEELG